MTTKYRALNLEMFRLDTNATLTYSAFNSSYSVLSDAQARLLLNCRIPSSLEEHVQRLYIQMSQEMRSGGLSGFLERLSENYLQNKDRIQNIRKELFDFIENGLLISDLEIQNLIHIGNTEGEQTENTISMIGHITRNRPKLLIETLRSHMTNQRVYERNNAIVIIDGSDCPEIGKYYKQGLQQLSSEFEQEVCYAGYQEKKNYLKSLVNLGISPSIAEFALFGSQEQDCLTGANRNTLLLHSIKNMLLSFDDDVFCKSAVSPEYRKQLRIEAGNDPTNIWAFSENSEELTEGIKFEDTDIQECHEKLLGKSLSDCRTDSDFENKINLENITYELFHRLKLGRSKVRMTLSGIIGDSGCYLPNYLNQFNDKTLERVKTRQFNGNSPLIDCKSIFRVSNGYAISDLSYCMTYAVGLDNRSCLPPFMPVGRAQDGVFGGVLWSCFKDSLFGHIPWALLHLPPEKRQYPRDSLRRFLSTYRLNDLLFWIIMSYKIESWHTDAQQNMQKLGLHIQDIGNLQRQDFEKYVHHLKCIKFSKTYEYLSQAILTSPNIKHLWFNDLESELESVKKSLLKFIPSTDVGATKMSGSNTHQDQDILMKFGKLLYEWPNIITAASELQYQDIRPAYSV